MDKPLRVTDPFIPPLDEFVGYLEGIWERRQLTNHGPLACRFEQVIRDCQGIDTPVHLVANGALGLQILLRALGVTGELVTTPFSFIATTSCPAWDGCAVRFADIEPDTLTIDPAAVEAAITSATEAILATHVYGNPCDCAALESIARKHGLALVYDAAHAYGVRHQGRSILAYGDASMVSLHATKLLHAVEGGLMVARDPDVSRRAEWMRRFGFDGEDAYHGIGINAKMSELHAAMGLCVHRHLPEIMTARHAACAAYDDGIAAIDGVRRAFRLREDTIWNAAYYPVRFESEARLLRAREAMQRAGVFGRRYFHPALHEAGVIEAADAYPEASKASREVFCLPLSATTTDSDTARVLEVLADIP